MGSDLVRVSASGQNAPTVQTREKCVPLPHLSPARRSSSLPHLALPDFSRRRRFPAPLATEYRRDSPDELLHLVVVLDLVVWEQGSGSRPRVLLRARREIELRRRRFPRGADFYIPDRRALGASSSTVRGRFGCVGAAELIRWRLLLGLASESRTGGFRSIQPRRVESP